MVGGEVAGAGMSAGENGCRVSMCCKLITN